ncbi:CD1871A family CXXC motif-containing protein [Clostridium sp. UBA6640]|nr:CD1871A family CXXC motif-containing protein [Clostridium sp. UBA6640]
MKDKILKYGILIGSICLIVVGSIRGEHRTVLKKAINICLECIGIG